MPGADRVQPFFAMSRFVVADFDHGARSEIRVGGQDRAGNVAAVGGNRVLSVQVLSVAARGALPEVYPPALRMGKRLDTHAFGQFSAGGRHVVDLHGRRA